MTYEREREGETFKRERERERELCFGVRAFEFLCGGKSLSCEGDEVVSKSVFKCVLCTLFIFKIFFIVFYLFFFFENHIVLFINSTFF